jgi:O-antigen ligase
MLAIETDGRSLNLLCLIAFLFLFFYFKNNSAGNNKWIETIIIVLCLLQAIYGLFQYFQVIQISSKFPIVGSFDNPAGFAACLAVALPLSFSLLKYSKYYKLPVILSIVIIVVTIVLSESRAGIVSISAIIAISLYSKYKDKFDRFRKYLTFSFIIIGITIFLLLLFLKKESASGRILIWNITWVMIKDAPLLGHGSGAFLAEYMDYQADYFIQNPQSKYAALADNVLHPFNEYLLLIAEYGFIGFALLLVVIFFLLKYGRNSSLHMLCLISLGIFSLFSYPLNYPFVWVIMAYCLAKISKNQGSVYTFRISDKKWIKVSVLICMALGTYTLMKDIAFEYQWNKTAKKSLLGKTKEIIPQYEYLHSSWNHNYLFLYNYGAELNYIKKYSKSIEILHQCEKYFNDYDVQMLLADNYYNLNILDESEKHYRLASNMCPNRFLPLFQMMKIYDNRGEIKNTVDIATVIIYKEVKIPSPATTKIKIEARERIKSEIDTMENAL